MILFLYTLICHYMHETWSWHAYRLALGFFRQTSVTAGHMGIFTFTSQRSNWPVVMSSRAEYSGYAVYPKSFRVSHKSAGKPPPLRQFKWVHACTSTVMDPEADIWNKWQMSELDANTCTKISSHGYKRRLPTQTTTKGFKLFTRFQWVKGVSLILT
jgi:hypothetical protein